MHHGAVAMDTEMDKEYKHEQLAGAVFASYFEQILKEAELEPVRDDYKAITSLSQDKPLIFMGNRPKCWKPYQASKVAIRRSFKKVHGFRDGVPEWREQARPQAHTAMD